MPVKTGRLADFRRALDRVDPSLSQGFDPREHLSSSDALPRELAEQLRKLDTDELLDILQGADAQLAANRDVQRFVADLVKARTGDDELDEEELAARDGAAALPPEEEREFFVGWSEGAGGEISFVSHSYDPNDRAQIAYPTLEAYRSRSGAGGKLGKVGNHGDILEAIKLQQQNDRWAGTKLAKFGNVDAKELMWALKSVITPSLKELLGKEGNDVVTLCLQGRQAVLLTRDGGIHALNRIETRHLALVGILPRHWFLPLMWWKQMLAEEESALAERGRSKKKIYKGKYDDEEADQEEQEDKERE